MKQGRCIRLLHNVNISYIQYVCVYIYRYYNDLWFFHRHQTGEGSVGSGSSSGAGGSAGMKGSSRQRSPGAMARNSETMDDSNPHPSTAEPEDFVPNIHPPTDDEGVLNIFCRIFVVTICNNRNR